MRKHSPDDTRVNLERSPFLLFDTLHAGTSYVLETKYFHLRYIQDEIKAVARAEKQRLRDLKAKQQMELQRLRDNQNQSIEASEVRGS